MADQEEKDKRSKQRKRNFYAKLVREHKQFHPKIIEKERYKRVKFNPKDINEDNEE